MILKCLVIFLLMFELGLCGDYKGESFPKKYLAPEDLTPEKSDAAYYLRGIDKILGQFGKHANETCINRGLGVFFMKAILKRTMIENKNKITKDQDNLLRSIMLQAEDVFAHFYTNVINPLDWEDILRRTAYLLKDVDLQVEAIGEFKRNLFTKWILSGVSLNKFEQDMDEIKFPKEMYIKYCEESLYSKNYIVNIDDSDYCLGEVIYNPTPLGDTKTFKPCVYDEFCSKIIYGRASSFSYALSHRLLNMLMARHLRRCYLQDPEDDEILMEALCSSMYRETVYLARRGYFFTDIFMEHIALCGLLGYEEFFRRNWFRKVVSWIDNRGCIAENFNYEVNRSRYYLEKEPELSRIIIGEPCSWHQMSLSVVVLAHGVRHAVAFSELNNAKDEL